MRHISSTHVSTKQNCYSKNTLETKLYFLSKDRTQKNLENLSILCFVVYSENNREFACRYSRFLLEFRGVEKGVRIWCWGEVKSDAHVCCQISLSTRGYITFILQYMMISFQKNERGCCLSLLREYNQRFPREIHPTLDKDDISAFTISAFLSFVDHRKISICQGTWRQLLAKVSTFILREKKPFSLSTMKILRQSLGSSNCFLKDCCCKKRRVFFMGPPQLC